MIKQINVLLSPLNTHAHIAMLFSALESVVVNRTSRMSGNINHRV